MAIAMIPETKFEWIDKSKVQNIAKADTTIPVCLYAFASEKGEEDIQVIRNGFKAHYGSDLSFSKYGQALAQATRSSEAGAVIIAKRVVAEDSTLANTAIVANVTKVETQKVDKDGNLLYTDKITGQETIEASGNDAIMVSSCKIKFECQTVENCKSIEEAYSKIDLVGNNETGIFPLMLLSDNGRGLSKKKFKISADYIDSKSRNYVKYNLYVMEGNKIVETIPFMFNPDLIESGMNRSIQTVVKAYSKQIKARVFESETFAFLDKVAEFTGFTQEFLLANDVLFAKDKKGQSLNGLEIDYTNDGFNLSYNYGIELNSGSNGEFGSAPVGTDAYKDALVDFFGGEYSDDIYDLDKYKIDLILDANYPVEVKEKIATLVTFREDALYIRDLGLGLKTLDDITSSKFELIKNNFILDQQLSYDVIDTYSKKQVNVTVCYTLAIILVDHFKTGRHKPLAGELHKFVLHEAIPGTVNFIPKVTPSYNQKQVLIDNQINYATYYDDKLVMETFYTAQEEMTQLSFANNVLAIQEVAKGLRTKCPKVRYKFIDGDDLEKYTEDVTEELSKYVANFSTLRMVYLQDETMSANKVFYAAIEFVCRDFVQAEHFKLYILNKEDVQNV